MKFYQRLAYYLAGFLIGCVLLFTIFNKRGQDFNYLPNARTLDNIRSKDRVYTAEAQKTLSEGWIDTAGVSAILRYGDVDFDKSKSTVDSGKVYIIEGKNAKGQRVVVDVLNCDSTAVIRSISR